MVKGHLNQVQQNLRFTKTKIVTIDSNMRLNSWKPPPTFSQQTPYDMEGTHWCYALILNLLAKYILMKLVT